MGKATELVLIETFVYPLVPTVPHTLWSNMGENQNCENEGKASSFTTQVAFQVILDPLGIQIEG